MAKRAQSTSEYYAYRLNKSWKEFKEEIGGILLFWLVVGLGLLCLLSA